MIISVGKLRRLIKEVLLFNESVKITDPDVFEKISQIEGDRWQKYEASPKGDEEYSLRYVVRRWHEITQQDKDDTEIDQTDIVNGCTIYGLGGLNRYYVNYAGDVLFSRHHATPANVEKARALGFKIN